MAENTTIGTINDSFIGTITESNHLKLMTTHEAFCGNQIRSLYDFVLCSWQMAKKNLQDQEEWRQKVKRGARELQRMTNGGVGKTKEIDCVPTFIKGFDFRSPSKHRTKTMLKYSTIIYWCHMRICVCVRFCLCPCIYASLLHFIVDDTQFSV